LSVATDGGDLVRITSRGLYCAVGDFHIDPWRPVARAVITHAHADHARPGHGAYLATGATAAMLGSASPRKPRVATCSRSANVAILLVA